MAELFSQIWIWIASALGGVSIAGIISAIIYGCLKGAFNRTIAKINIQKISEETADKSILKIKDVSFKHSIQPIVEGELKKINEYATEVVKEQLAKMEEKYNKLLNVIEKLSAYFDNSIGVSENAKQELKQAITDAKNEPVEPESVETEEIIVEGIKSATEVKETPNNTITTSKVER